MRLRENSILEIQTAESGAIIIEKHLNDKGLHVFKISEIEGYGGTYWNCEFNTVEECLNDLEIHKHSASSSPQDRSYSSWWLYAPVLFSSQEAESIIKKFIIKYLQNGQLEWAYLFRIEISDKSFRNQFFRWTKLCGLELEDKKITKKRKPILSDWIDIEIYFEGFNGFMFKNYIPLKISITNKVQFQELLDMIYSFIHKKVPKRTYFEKWILINLDYEIILTKGINEYKLTESLASIGFGAKNKILCKLINH